jgi:hypothetical protein
MQGLKKERKPDANARSPLISKKEMAYMQAIISSFL